MTTPRNQDHDRSSHHDHDGGHESAVTRRLARFMVDTQADSFDAQDAMRELAWADGSIRGFWLDEADALVTFLGLEEAA